MSPKNQPHHVGFQGGNQQPPPANPSMQGYPPAVPVFGFVDPSSVPITNSYGAGGPGGVYPAPSGGFDPEATSVGGNYGKLVDPESQNVKNFSFNDQSIRRGFIRKVYSILMCQLLVTFGVVALFVYHMPTQRWAMRNQWFFFGTMIILLVSTLFMACFEDALRKTPTNFMFLGFFTVAESVLVGYICTLYDPETILMAVGVTTVIVLGLTLFALQSKYDFTTCGGILLILLLLLFMVGLVGMFWPGKTMHMVISSFGAILFSFYLIYDTQLMMGGEHKYSISPEDYIFAAINIYLDIINLFLYILRILGSKK